MSAYVIAGLPIGTALLGFVSWWASLWSASRKRNDVAPGADVPESLYAMQQRRGKR